MFDADILAFEPFGIEEGVRVFSDRFLKTRKEHACVVCSEAIPAGSRVRSRAEMLEGERRFGTFYFCTACCAAMAAAVRDGDPDPFFARFRNPDRQKGGA